MTQRRNQLGAVFLLLFTDLVSFSIIFPLFAEMLVWYHDHDAGGWLALGMRAMDALAPGASSYQQAALFGGVIAAAYAGLQFLTAPWWGRLSDRIGRRPVILISLAGSALAYLGWVLAGSFLMLLLSRLAAGALSGAVSAANAAVADITGDGPERTKGMALVGMAFALGFIVGPMLGGLLGHVRIDTPALAAWGVNPFSVPALVALTLALVNLGWVWWSFAETLPPERRGRAGDERTANPLRLFSGDLGTGVGLANLVFFGHTLLFSAKEATLVFYAAETLRWQIHHLGFLFAGMGVMSAAVQGGLVRRLAPTTGPKPLAWIGLLLLIPGYVLIALAASLGSTALIIGCLLLAAAAGFAFPALAAQASLLGDPARQGHVSGAFRSAGALGRALGPLLGAALYFAIAPSAPYWAAAIGVALPLAVLYLVPAVPSAVEKS